MNSVEAESNVHLTVREIYIALAVLLGHRHCWGIARSRDQWSCIEARVFGEKRISCFNVNGLVLLTDPGKKKIGCKTGPRLNVWSPALPYSRGRRGKPIAERLVHINFDELANEEDDVATVSMSDDRAGHVVVEYFDALTARADAITWLPRHLGQD